MAAGTPGPIDIDSRLELMVDDHLIERFSGSAALHLHRPVAREIVFPERVRSGRSRRWQRLAGWPRIYDCIP